MVAGAMLVARGRAWVGAGAAIGALSRLPADRLARGVVGATVRSTVYRVWCEDDKGAVQNAQAGVRINELMKRCRGGSWTARPARLRTGPRYRRSNVVGAFDKTPSSLPPAPRQGGPRVFFQTPLRHCMVPAGASRRSSLSACAPAA